MDTPVDSGAGAGLGSTMPIPFTEGLATQQQEIQFQFQLQRMAGIQGFRSLHTYHTAKANGGLSSKQIEAIDLAQQETGMYPAYRGREPSAAVLNDLGIAAKPGNRESLFGIGGLRLTIPKGGFKWNIFSWRIHTADIDMNFVVKPNGLTDARESNDFVRAVQDRWTGRSTTCPIQHGCNYTGIQQQISGATWERQAKAVVVLDNGKITLRL